VLIDTIEPKRAQLAVLQAARSRAVDDEQRARLASVMCALTSHTNLELRVQCAIALGELVDFDGVVGTLGAPADAHRFRLNRERENTMSTEEPRPEKQQRPLGELRQDDRGHDEVREALEEGISLGEARPLTREEREAAARDKGISEPVYAPASERVPKPPAPGDEKFVQRKED